MNKSELVSQTKRQMPELTREQVEAVVDRVFSNIEDHLASGENVLITKFGTFQVTERVATRRRNPRDGNLIEIPASKKISFRPSPLLLEKIKDA